ncbi:MAG: 50S ribosomal protein L21 [Planctomycetota bacterium]
MKEPAPSGIIAFSLTLNPHYVHTETMYAVIDNHGKQYKVEPGDQIQVDLMDCEEGELVEFERVLMVGGEGKPRIGAPQLLGARVLAEVIRHEKGPKLTMMRFQAKANRQAKKGHRQKYTRVLIREIHPE